MTDHQQPRLFSRPDRLTDPLYVVTPVINAGRFRTRWKMYEDFAKHVAEAGAILYTVEVAFGDRAFVIPDSPTVIRLRTLHELWLKERAINLGVQRLPQDWKYVAWVDADGLFIRHDWADETRHALQHWPIVQMWSQLIDLDQDYNIMQTLRSFMDIQLNGVTPRKKSCYGQEMIGAGQKFGAPGMAWAARREAWNQLGGLIDYSILGAGDWYFANAIMGTMDTCINLRNDVTGPFMEKMLRYQENVRQSRWEERSILGNVGLVKGVIAHYWHGPRINRKYGTRGEILARAVYDPDKDLKVDWQGLYQLTNRNPQLRKDIQKYFSERNEDAQR